MKRVFQSFVDEIFGYDVFISYTRLDDLEKYAVALAEALRSKGLICFVDSKDFESGLSWREQGKRSLKRSAKIVFILSKSAPQSRGITDELEFNASLNQSKRQISVIKLEPDTDVQKSEDQFIDLLARNGVDLNDDLWVRESSRLLPSEDVVNRINNDFRLRRQMARRVRALVAALGIVVLLAIIAVFFGVHATLATRKAQRQGRRVSAQKFSAQSAQMVGEARPQLGSLLAFEAIETQLAHGERPLTVALSAAYQALGRIGGEPVATRRGRIDAVAVSDDGRWIAYGGDGATVEALHLDGVVIRAAWPLEGHGTGVDHLAFVPGSHRLVAAGRDGFVHLWKLNEAGRPIPSANRKIHQRVIKSLAIGGDGAILTSSWDNTIKLTPIAEDTFGASFCFNATNVQVAAMSRNWVAAGCADANVLLWRLGSDPVGIPLVLQRQHSAIGQCSFSPDGNWLLAGGIDTEAHLTPMFDHSPTNDIELKGHANSVFAGCFSPDGNWVATGSDDGTVRLWNLKLRQFSADSAIVLKSEIGAIKRLSFCPRSRFLLGLGRSNAGQAWEVTTDLNEAPKILLRGHDGEIGGFAWTSTGACLLTGGEDFCLRRWDFTQPNPEAGLFPIELRGPKNQISKLSASPDGKELFSIDDSCVFRTWDISDILEARGRLSRSVEHQAEKANRIMHSVNIDSDRGIFSYGTRDGHLQVYDGSKTGSKELSLRKRNAKPILRVASSPNGKWMAAADALGVVNIWALTNSGAMGIPVLTNRSLVTDLIFSPHSQFVVIGDDKGAVTIVDISTPGKYATRRLTAHKDVITALFFSRDSRFLVGASCDATASVTDLWKSAAPSISLRGHKQGRVPLGVQALAYCDNGRLIGTGGVDETVRIWGKSGERFVELSCLRGYSRGPFGHGVKTIAFASSGDWLASGAENGIVRLWDLSDSESSGPVEIQASAQAVTTVLITANDRWLVAGGDDGIIRLWPLAVSEISTGIRNKVGRNLNAAEWSRFFGRQPYRELAPGKFVPDDIETLRSR